MSEVFPQPFGPISAVRAPVGSTNDACSKSVCPPGASRSPTQLAARRLVMPPDAPRRMRMETSSRGRSFFSSRSSRDSKPRRTW